MFKIFNKRYFVVGVLIYILSVYIAFDCNVLFAEADLSAVLQGTIITVGVFLAVYIILRKLFCKNYGVVRLCTASFIFMLIFVLGFNGCIMRCLKYDKDAEIMAGATVLEGTVATDISMWSTDKSYGIVLDVSCVEIKHENEPEIEKKMFKKPCYVLVYASKKDFDTPPNFGDRVRCGIRHFQKNKPAFDGDFDYLEKLRQNKIVYNAYADKTEIGGEFDWKDKNPVLSKFKNFGLKIRNAVLKSTELTEYGENENALLRGILVGDTLCFSDDLYGKLKSSGFIHIASVSGMHTSYLYAVVCALLGLLKTPRRWMCCVTIPLLVLFAAVALFSPSVCRSVIMMIVMLTATMLRRDNDSITSLFLAALILTIDNPYCLKSYSFLLSFGATLGILVYYQLFRNRLSFAVVPMKEGRKHGVIRKSLYKLNEFSINSICLSIGGTIGISYFMMRLYGVLRWGSIIGNIPLIPLTAVSFIGGYANSLIYYVSKPLAEIVARFIVNPSLWLTNRLAEIFSADIFGITAPSLSKVFFVIYIFICIVIYYWVSGADNRRYDSKT